MSEKTCKECGSSRFLEIRTVSRIITGFEENGKPLTYEDEESMDNEINCLRCLAPIEGVKGES